MTLDIEVRDLSIRYGEVTALDQLSLRLAGSKIHGLLGRNGAGKSTLLSVLAAYRKPTSGSVLVGGENPFENARLMPQICFVRENVDAYETERCSEALRAARYWRPNWDADYADALIADGLVDQAGGDQRIRFRASADISNEVLLTVPGVQSVVRDAELVTATGRGDIVVGIVLALADRGVTPTDVRVDRANLEDAFVQLSGRQFDATPDRPAEQSAPAS